MLPAEFAELSESLTLVHLAPNQIIYEQRQPIDAVYFVESGLVSRSISTAPDDRTAVALLGANGLIGLAAVLGTMTALHGTTVLVSGVALRIDAEQLKAAITRRTTILNHLLRYAEHLLVQVSCIAVCNAKHNVQKRLSRFLLHSMELVGTAELPFTHEQLASILGVRRAGITESLLNLENNGAISKARGTVELINREALETHSCDCCDKIRQTLGLRRRTNRPSR